MNYKLNTSDGAKKKSLVSSLKKFLPLLVDEK